MESFSSPSSSSHTRKLCIGEGDDGIASIAGMESGCSWNHPKTGPFCYTKRNSSRNLYHHSSHNPVPFTYFLDSCFLCKKPLAGYKDIFMYRGNTPFCSQECREEQIERDEAKEKKQSLSSSMKAMRRKEHRKSSSASSSLTKSQDYPFSNGTVVAAAPA